MSQDSTGYGPRNRLLFNGDENDYSLWEVRFLGYMALQGLKDTILSDDEATPDNTKDARAYAELVQILDTKSLQLVMSDADDKGSKALKILRQHYAGKGKQRVLALYSELTNLQKRESESMTEFILRTERAATSLKSAGETVSDSLLIAMVLKGLPDSCSSFVAVITQSDDDKMTFVKFKVSLRNFSDTEEARLNKASSDSVMKNSFKRNIQCFTCKKEGHYANDCSIKVKYCTICKRKGHTIQTCRNKRKDSSINSVTSNHSFAFSICTENEITHGLLVDTGATAHVINDESLFVKYDDSFQPDKHFIELADGNHKNNVAKRKGTAEIKLLTAKNEEVVVQLNDALFVPSYPINIFSVQSATNRGATVKFSPDSAVMTAKDKTKFDIKRSGKLYFLQTVFSTTKVNKVHSLDMWHRIMGHLNFQDLMKLENVVEGMNVNSTDKGFCDVCHKGKQPHNSVNRTADAKAKAPLDLIHTDLSGPITPTAKDGFRFVINFIDDYSGMVFPYFLKKKSDSCIALKKFIADVSIIGIMKILRSDNGGEFISGEFQQCLFDNNIKHQKSAPYTPEQNGTVERGWRTIFDMSRCMIIESDVPKHLWTYAVAAASYTRNRCYQQRTKKTAFELFIGKKPNIEHMMPFGSECYVRLENVRKLDERAERRIFLGYDRSSPSYIVYNPDDRSVKCSRNVKFNLSESVPPCDSVGIPHIAKPIDQDDKLNDEDIKHKVVDKVEDKVEANPTVEETINVRPKRVNKLPSYLQDYVLDDKYNEDECKITIDYCCKMNMNIPRTIEEALASEEAYKWKEAMHDEVSSLRENNTWDIVKLPEHCNVISGKWVFNLKSDNKNNITKYKARYVAHGFLQREGIDYQETFAPTARLVSIRTILQCAIMYDFTIHQMDVKTAFLNAPIDYPVYLKQPKGFEEGEDLVCRLNKSLYGLKQSSRMWNITIDRFMCDMKFQRSDIDHCLYIRKTDTDIIYIIIWVDDILIAASNNDILNEVKRALNNKFKMSDLGQLKWFLGMEFNFGNTEITVNQTQYLKNILTDFGMQNCKPVSTPCVEKPDFDKAVASDLLSRDSEEEKHEAGPLLKRYRSAVGSLIYCMICTRPDLSWIVTKLSQFNNNPTEVHWQAVKRVFRYLKHTLDYCLTFRKSEEDVFVHGFCDADWASSSDRHSITGYCFSLINNGCAISWKSKRQQTVALSTCEAEYMALTAALQEALSLRYLMKEVCPHYNSEEPVVIFEDNQGAIALAQNPVAHNRTKHIDVKYHFIRENISNKTVHLRYIPTDQMIADCLTKPLGRVKLDMCNNELFGSNMSLYKTKFK